MNTKLVITATLILLLLAVAGFAQDQGGPDTFGYTWKNSNVDDGPVYTWIEPNTTNDAVALYTEFDDDGNTPMIPLNFNFPYYGNVYSEICIGTNGILGFSIENMSHRFSQDFPDATEPDNIIAWLYTDLNPLYTWADSHCYFENIEYNDQDAFMITFVDYAEYYYSGTSPEYTVDVQIILSESGDIIFNYQRIGTSVSLADVSIGMENADATDGLCYVCDDAGFSIPDNFAIEFYRPAATTIDLVASSISGNTTPSVGADTDYTISITNQGVETQSTYTVYLKDANGNELGSAAGTEIAQYESADIVVTWAPETEGAMGIYGEVVVTGDENDTNNTTNEMIVTVQPQGITVISLGTDQTTSNYMPFNYYYRNSLSETIFYPEELGLEGGGLLTAIQFYNHFPTDETVIDTVVNIWVGETELNDLADGYIPSTDLTQVFSGLVNFPAGENDILITFDEPYEYTGGNLVIMTHRPWDPSYYDSNCHFYYSVTEEYPNRTASSPDDTTEFDPANPPTDDLTLYDRIPNISLFFDSSAATGVTGYVYDDQTSPISGATVTMTPGDVEFTTGPSGAFSFLGIEPGTYSFEAVAEGYVTDTIEDVVVTEGETSEITFFLDPVMTVTITVTTNAGSPEGAELVFSNGTDTYEETVPEDGIIHFYEIANGTYTLGITLEGFSYYYDDSVAIDGMTDIDVELTETTEPPTNLECDDEAYFTWEAPADPDMLVRSTSARKQIVQNVTRNTKGTRQEILDRPLQNYRVYLDGTFLSTTNNLNYQFETEGMTVGQTYTAGVSAQYVSGESEIVTVDFIYGYEELYAPINVACDSLGHLTWESGQPASLLRKNAGSKDVQTMDRDFIQYRVYLDDEYVDWTLATEFTFDDLEVNTTYTAGVSAFYTAGNSEIIEVEFIYMPASTSQTDVTPATTAIVGNFPNPFNPETTIQFSTSKPGHTTLTIFNVKGQKVKTLVDANLDANVHSVIWNGQDNSGKNVTSGVYYAVLKAAGENPAVQKMILLK